MRSVAIDPEGFRFLGLRLVDGGIGGGVDYNGRLNAVEKCGDAGVARKIDDGASSNDKIGGAFRACTLRARATWPDAPITAIGWPLMCVASPYAAALFLINPRRSPE